MAGESDKANTVGPGDSERTFVLAERFGKLCVIPLDEFKEAWLAEEGVDRIISAGAVGFADVDELADGIDDLRYWLEGEIYELLDAAKLTDTAGIWDYLVENDLVEGGAMPNGWQPTQAQADQVRVDVPIDNYGEGGGLLGVEWADKVPRPVVQEFGHEEDGVSGAYFSFDLNDKNRIEAALEGLGYRVVDESKVIDWESHF